MSINGEKVFAEPTLHCGACMEPFEDPEVLVKHIEHCPAAKCLMPVLSCIHNFGDPSPHRLRAFIYFVKNSYSLINLYINSVVSPISFEERTRRHKELCASLHLDYTKFKPFEDTNILRQLTHREAKAIFWLALKDVGTELINKAYGVELLQATEASDGK